MAVKIRLTRFGRLHRPFYRIGVFDGRMRRDGEALEYVGFYDPLLTTGQIWKIDLERVKAWMAQGAVPSETVASFLRKEGLKTSNPVASRTKNQARAKTRAVARKKAKTRAKTAAKAKAAS